MHEHSSLHMNIQVNLESVFWKFGLKISFRMVLGVVSNFKTQIRLLETWNRANPVAWMGVRAWILIKNNDGVPA